MPKTAIVKKSRDKKYQVEWEKESWAKGWLQKGKKEQHARCKYCDKDLAAGSSELKKHATLLCHTRSAKTLTSTTTTSFDNHFVVGDGTIKAELNTVDLIARRNIPFNCVNYLLPTLKFIAPV